MMFHVERAAEEHSWVVVNEHGVIISQTQSQEDAINEACKLAEMEERDQAQVAKGRGKTKANK